MNVKKICWFKCNVCGATYSEILDAAECCDVVSKIDAWQCAGCTWTYADKEKAIACCEVKNETNTK